MFCSAKWASSLSGYGDFRTSQYVRKTVPVAAKKKPRVHRGQLGTRDMLYSPGANATQHACGWYQDSHWSVAFSKPATPVFKSGH
jgi:hypothetical protein